LKETLGKGFVDVLFEGALLARVLCFVVGGKSHLRSFAFADHHDVPAVVYSLYRFVLNKICEQDLCFWKEKKTAHLECFVFAFMISQ
jgi:hypothetical protein